MTRIIGIILIIAGVVLFSQGLSRKDSLVGHASKVGDELANSVDGGNRQPKHVVYMVGGGLLVIVGAGLTFRRSPTV
jgi:hypothetical protein